MRISIKVDDKLARAAMQRTPGVVERHMELGLERGADEVAREARSNASKRDLFGTLRNSIHVEHPGLLRYVVATATNYAKAVEEGTGPAVGNKRYYPNPDSLQQYLMQSPKMRGHKWARKDSAKRGGQELDIWFRSRALAWYIYNHGTKPQPFMAPAAAEKEDRVRQLVRASVMDGVREVFG